MLVIILVIALLAALLLPALSRVRELSRRTKCGKNANQIATSQNAWATAENQRGRPETFLTGTEPDARGEKEEPLAEARTHTDASRAFVLMAKKMFVDNLSQFAYPSDPFVAVLTATGRDIPAGEVDMPAEGKGMTAGAPWSAPGSPAAKEEGHSYYSYSMQSGSKNVRGHLGPKLSASIPLVGERNPFDKWLSNPTLGGDPLRDSEAGNAWNHNREGQTLAFTDGRTAFLEAADMLQVPMSAAVRDQGFDYLYNDADPVADPKRPAPGGKAVKRSETARCEKWGSWLTD